MEKNDCFMEQLMLFSLKMEGKKDIAILGPNNWAFVKELGLLLACFWAELTDFSLRFWDKRIETLS